MKQIGKMYQLYYWNIQTILIERIVPSSQEGEGFKNQMVKLITALDGLRSQFANAMQKNGVYSTDPHCRNIEETHQGPSQCDHRTVEAPSTPAAGFSSAGFPVISHSAMDIPLPDGMKGVALRSEGESEKSERFHMLGAGDSGYKPFSLQKRVSISEHVTVSPQYPPTVGGEVDEVQESIDVPYSKDVPDINTKAVAYKEEGQEIDIQGSDSDFYEEEFEDDFEDGPSPDLKDDPGANQIQASTENDASIAHEDDAVKDELLRDSKRPSVSSEISNHPDKGCVSEEDYSMSYGDDPVSADRSADEDDYEQEAFDDEEELLAESTEASQSEECGRNQINEHISLTQESQGPSSEIDNVGIEQCNQESSPGPSEGGARSPVESSASMTSSQVVDDIMDNLTRELSFENEPVGVV